VGKAEKRAAKAAGRVLSRHVLSAAAGFCMPYDRFLREVTAEIVRDLDKRTAKNIRVALAAADQVMALVPRSSSAAAEDQSGDLDPAGLEVVKLAGEQQCERDGRGLPRWHPDHPSFGTGTQETTRPGS
jgi:hypothetical protein